MLDVRRPEDHGNRESEAQPKLVAKHRDGVSGVTVVVSVSGRHIVIMVRVGRFPLRVACQLIHLELRSQYQGRWTTNYTFMTRFTKLKSTESLPGSAT